MEIAQINKHKVNSAHAHVHE